MIMVHTSKLSRYRLYVHTYLQSLTMCVCVVGSLHFVLKAKIIFAFSSYFSGEKQETAAAKKRKTGPVERSLRKWRGGGG